MEAPALSMREEGQSVAVLLEIEQRFALAVHSVLVALETASLLVDVDGGQACQLV